MELGFRPLALTAGLCIVLGGCAPQSADVDADRMGRTVIDSVQRGDWPAINRAMTPTLMADPGHAPEIEQVRAVFPTDPPWSIKLLKSDRRLGEDRLERSNLSYLYVFAQRRLAIDLTVQQIGWRRTYEPRLGVVSSAAPQPVEFDEPPKPKPGEQPYKTTKVFALVAIRAKGLVSTNP